MLKKLLLILILSIASISLYSMDNNNCNICLEALTKKPGAYKEIRVKGYRKLPDCNHKFHHCCIMKWYLSKYSRDKNSKVVAHRSCPECRKKYNHEFHKSLREKLSRPTGPYAGLQKKYRKERKKIMREKFLEDEQESARLARLQETEFTEGDEDLARQLQAQVDQEEDKNEDWDECDDYDSQGNTLPLNQAFDAGSGDEAEWSD